jgi:peptidoglycan-associated lipoprotein
MRVLRKSPWCWLWMALPLVFVFSGCATKQAVSEKPSLAAEKGLAEVGRPSPAAEASQLKPERLEAERRAMMPGESMARPGREGERIRPEMEKRMAEPGLERGMAQPGVKERMARPGVVEEVVKPRPGMEVRPPEAITLARPAPKPVPSAEGAISPFKDIHFDFDKYNLRLDAKWVLNDIAQWLEGNPHTRVMIEGHADERGSDEYNLALGERRAASARYYLISMGVKGERLSTISYGEFRPIDSGRTEEAYTRNRRDHFLLRD